MKLIKLTVFIALAILLVSCNCGKNSAQEIPESGSVCVEIHYAKDSTKTTDVKWTSKLTALEALQYAANIETHPLGDFVFVSKVGDSAGVRGEKAWYYTLNRKPAKLLAINQMLASGDTVSWIFKEDVCSKTVDGCK